MTKPSTWPKYPLYTYEQVTPSSRVECVTLKDGPWPVALSVPIHDATGMMHGIVDYDAEGAVIGVELF